MSWNSPKTNTQEQATQTPAQNTQAQNNSLAYIHKDTREAMKSNPEIESIANATLELAKQVMDKVKEEGKTFEKTTRDGSKTYTASMVVKVEPAVNYKTGEPMLYKNGDRAGQQVYKATAEIENKGTTLTLFASQKEDKVELTSMTANRWNEKEGRMGKYGKGEKMDAPIQEAYINANIKAVADVIERAGFIHEKVNLFKFKEEIDNFLSSNTEPVLNPKTNELVDNEYAMYKKDDYGERIIVSANFIPDENGKVTENSPQASVSVELGVTSKGEKYALATNFNPEYKDENGKFAKAFINNLQDVAEYIETPNMATIISEYKGFNEKEQEKKAPNKSKQSIERD